MEVPTDPNYPTLDSQQHIGGSHSEFSGYPPQPEPTLKGDVQGAEVGAYLRKRINEEQFDAYCIDCQNNRSSHCNVTFGTFICTDCARVHEQTFSQFQSYIKPLFDGAWDQFQISMVKIGGNKRFFEFLREYGKERDPIVKKYDNSASLYYRRRLCAEAKRLRFDEHPPSKSVQEFATKAVDQTGKFFAETNEKYEISRRTHEAAETAKVGIMNLFAKAKTLVAKKPPQEQHAQAAAQSHEHEMEAGKQPQNKE